MTSVNAQLQVAKITPANAAVTIPQGPDASGGLGDWWLSNGTLCAVVAAVEHETELSARGGVLVDLGFCDRADDHFVSMQDLLEGSRRSPVDIDRVEIAQSEDAVAIIAIGSRAGNVVETRYTLDLEQPTRLAIHKTIRAAVDREDGFGLYAPIIFNHYSMEPFLFASQDLSQSTGFVHEEFSERGSSAIRVAPRPADTIVYLSAPDALEPISYGWRLRSALAVDRRSGESVALPRFSLADAASTAFLVFPEPFTIGDGSSIGWLQVLQLGLMEHDPADELQLIEEIWVGKGGDVAAITDQLIDGPTLTARSDDRRIVVHVDSQAGTPITQLRPDTSGQLSAQLPAGRYQLRVIAPGNRQYQQSIDLTAAGLDLGELNLAAPSRVRLPRGQAMRLVFRGTNGTPDPRFGDSLTGLTVIDDDGPRLAAPVSADVFLAGVESDPVFVDVAPGDYRVYATRGIEFSVAQTTLTLSQGQAVPLIIDAPARAVESAGFIAADLHVHSGVSMDNAFSTEERVRTFVAEHGEVMVASEHETIFDFQPAIDAMGVADRIIAISGTEATSLVMSERLPHSAGHINFFPLDPDPLAYRRGAPANENLRLREMLHEVRKRNPAVVAQLNHPRSTAELVGSIPRDYADLINAGAYLEHMGPAGHPFDPDEPIHRFPNNVLIERDPVTGLRDIDVDAIEVMNFAQAEKPHRTKAVRADWIALLKQGIRLTATANSDSHQRAEQVALPRTMVAMRDDTLAHFDIDEFTTSLKRGDAFGTTGPLFDFALNGVGMGDTYRGTRGMLTVALQTADWVDVDEVHIQVNGTTVETLTATDGRLETQLEFAKDSFVTIEIEGRPGDVYQAIYPGYWPYAYSNPIYVDADGDGQWTPPGLD